eukprot:scaffold8356_cov215-Isochrysis_galbana.AAC.1
MPTSLARPRLRSRVDRLLQPLELVSRPGRGRESRRRTRSPSTRGNDWHRPERRARGRSRWWSALIRIEIDDFPTARRSTTERSGERRRAATSFLVVQPGWLWLCTLLQPAKVEKLL